MTDWEKSELFRAVSDCDRLILQADVDNDRERIDHRFDTRRLERHRARSLGLVELRRRLEAIYKATYGEDPWANIPF